MRRTNEIFLVYLAGPIANVPIEEARAWRRDFAHTLLTFLEGWAPAVTYDPASAFSVTAETPEIRQIIQNVNSHALFHSCLLVARFIRGIESRGTEQEIMESLIIEMPIVVFTDDVIGTTKKLAKLATMLDVDPEGRIFIEYGLDDAAMAAARMIREANTARALAKETP